MNKSTLVALGLALAGAMSAGPSAAQTFDEIGIARGSTPEAVLIENLDGEPVDLGDYITRGPVLLEFWATWCENCAALLPRLIKAHEQYSDRMEFFAVGVGVGQSPRSIRRHLRRHPMPYAVLFDAKGAAVRAFKTPATSYVVIMNAEGRVTYTGIGPDQDIGAAIRTALEP